MSGAASTIAPITSPIVVVMGVCGSGKSSIGRALAGRHGWSFLEGDDLHPPGNVERMSQGQPLTDDDRHDWLAAIGERIAEADHAGAGLVVACSALKRSYRDQLSAVSPRVMFLHLSGDRALIEARMAARAGHFMPLSLIDSQFATLEPPQPDERAVTLPIDMEPGALLDEAEDRLDRLQLQESAR
ncbi:gluconokinase [Starkeya sp. 3C]|uniref:Gluconokinase n=1 Tax=Ancylobacter moscoviensis TaxID=2597768 RepID=A0ABY3DVU8_9HYPH|nr:gluconokinase [Ancylobacter moscoviensis]TSJ64460.1 gluconokinase [Ancylobacter moscoviensis]